MAIILTREGDSTTVPDSEEERNRNPYRAAQERVIAVIDISSDEEESSGRNHHESISTESHESPLPRRSCVDGTSKTFTAKSPTSKLCHRGTDVVTEDTLEDQFLLEDDSILILDEPAHARRPLPKKSHTLASPLFPSMEFKPSQYLNDTDKGMVNLFPVRDILIDMSGKASGNKEPKSPSVPNYTLNTLGGNPKKRLTKKALAAAEQKKLEGYAEDLFMQLNRLVFKCRLPEGTALVWNNRLQTTAGRAKWHRSKDGFETSSIELATKVLDCEERVRNTLSHEMCHLACWVIDGDIKEVHGSKFKYWASQVMRERRDIVISTKHNYDIVFKYEWKCDKCSKIYGRHSKSIDPQKCVCGVCKEGNLIPQFPQRAPRTPQKGAASNLLSSSRKDSPCHISTHTPASPSIMHTEVSEDEVDDLIDSLRVVDISDT